MKSIIVKEDSGLAWIRLLLVFILCALGFIGMYMTYNGPGLYAYGLNAAAARTLLGLLVCYWPLAHYAFWQLFWLCGAVQAVIDDARPPGLRSKVVRRRRDRSAHDLPATTREATPKRQQRGHGVDRAVESIEFDGGVGRDQRERRRLREQGIDEIRPQGVWRGDGRRIRGRDTTRGALQKRKATISKRLWARRRRQKVETRFGEGLREPATPP